MRKFLISIIGLVMIAGCEPDLSDDAIPWQPFDVITLNLNLPDYISLKSDGTSKYLPDGGVRGIILYHQGGSNYLAYEANCSYQPNSACATVEIHVSTLYMFCACCSSSFDFATGYPTGGPAWRPLRRYETSLSGSTLTITDQIVE
ncbi:MAG TPA: hypothetical protein VFO54_11410 [Chryseosolibacter sp.]|nr:hypothetical protein [Chryseosolibacter sp.]